MVIPSKNRPFIEARSAISLIPPGQSLPNRYSLDTTAIVAAGATSITLEIAQINDAAPGGTEILELEDDHQIFLPGDQTVAAAAAGAIGDRKITIDDGAGGNPLAEVSDFIQFAGHTQLYRIGRINGQAVRIFPALTSPIADDEAVTVYQEIRVDLPADQVIDVDTTGVAVPVSGVKYGIISGGRSLDARAEKQNFGITTLNVAPAVISQDTSDTRSPNKQFITGSGVDVAIETFALDGELARPELLLSTILDTGLIATTGFYLNVRTAAGEIYQGPASPSESDSGNSVGESETFNITFSYDLSNLQFWLSV